LGRLKQALGLEAGRRRVRYEVSRGHYEAFYRSEKKARMKAKKMRKKYPGSEIMLSRNTFIEKERRPFWRFWRIENATLQIEPLTIEEELQDNKRDSNPE